MERYIGESRKGFLIGIRFSEKNGDREGIGEGGRLLGEELNKFNVFFGDTVSRFVDIG